MTDNNYLLAAQTWFELGREAATWEALFWAVWEVA